LSLDFGTSSLKASILTEEFDTIASTKIDYELQILPGDKIELNPDDVFAAFIQCTREFNRFIADVDVLAFDIFSPSVMFLDEKGESLYPIITHLDRRSIKCSEKILKFIGEEEFRSITGVLPFAGGVSATSILWMKENMPEIFNKAYKIGHFNTYFYKKLTGIWATDQVNASMMGLYETIKDGGWSKEICQALEIPGNKLPDIVDAGLILGKLCKEVAILTGLREGIPVALGTNDVAASQIGADNVEAGGILNISGSSEILSIITDKPVLNKKYYVRKAATPGKWQIFSTTAGGFAIEWFRREAYRDMDIDSFYRKYLAELVQKDNVETEVRFLPYLTGDRHSLRKKRGGFTGLTLETRRDDMLLAILFGIHEPMTMTMSLASEFLQLHKTIKLTGGLSRNNSLIRLKKILFPDYNFQVLDDCPIIGNVKLALSNSI
jgi:xylulokinase